MNKSKQLLGKEMLFTFNTDSVSSTHHKGKINVCILQEVNPTIQILFTLYFLTTYHFWCIFVLFLFSDGNESEDEAKEDIDIGHYSYIHACDQLRNPPIRKIFEQLQTNEIRLQYVGLNTNDVIALSYGLLVRYKLNVIFS